MCYGHNSKDLKGKQNILLPVETKQTALGRSCYLIQVIYYQ